MLTTLAARAGRIAVGAVMAVFGLIFFASLLTAGLLGATGLAAWALLRGRRPTLPKVYRFSRSGWMGSRRPEMRSFEVVDVQAREVPERRS